MKASTEALINSGIKTNIAIQQDNLAMLDTYLKVSEIAREVEIFDTIKDIAKTEDFDTLTFNTLNVLHGFCDKVGLDIKEQKALSVGDRRASVIKAIEDYNGRQINKIHKELTNMLDASIQDIDSVYHFKAVNKLAKHSVPTYSVMAAENLCDNFRTIIQEVSFAANTDKNTSFEALRSKLVKTLQDKLAMVHVAITHEGYVTVDVPQPMVQTSDKAGIASNENLQYMGKLMNQITYKQLTERLSKFKLNLREQLNDTTRLEDTVRKAHFLAQIIMSVKSSIKLMRDYHTAAINELGC